MAARASLRRGDENTAQQQLAQATEVLSKLRQKLGTDTFDSYLIRPDIKGYRKQLDEAFVVEKTNNQ